MKYPKLDGLIAAPFVAFRPDGQLNLDLIEAQAHSLVASGVKGAFVCGTTGEGVSLSVAERMAVAATLATFAHFKALRLTLEPT